MTKQEYMKQLKEKLNQFDPSLRSEIIEDYVRHFAEGEQLGLDDEEIIAELGSIDEMIAQLNEEGAQKNYPLTTTNYVEAESYRGVRFDLGIADVQIFSSPDNQLHIDTRGNFNEEAFTFNQREENGIFVLELISQGVNRFFFRQRIKVEAYLPSEYESVEIKTASGEIEMKNIQADYIRCISGSGDLEIKDSGGCDMELNTHSGNIEAVRLDLSKLEIQTGSGEVEVLDGVMDHLEIKSGSGDIECHTDAGQIFCKTGSGDVEVEVPHDCDILISSGSGDLEIKLQESEGAEVSYSTASGDVELSWKGEEVPVSKKGLKLFGNRSSHIGVKSGSGDIAIEME